MKRHTPILTALLLLFSLAAVGQTNPPYFYYYQDAKMPLELNPEYVYLVAHPTISSKEQLALYLGQQVEITKFAESNVGRTLHTQVGTATRASEYWAEVKLNNSAPYSEQLNQLRQNASVELAAPYFKNKTTDKIGLSNYFYVKLKNQYDLALLKETAQSIQVQLVGQNKFMPLWYTLKCTGNSQYNALQAANFFYETGRFAAAEPDLMVDYLLNAAATDIGVANPAKTHAWFDLVPADPLYLNQWGLNNTGQNGGTAGIDIQAEDAWDITTGDPTIVIAVLDQGFEMNHPDLAANTFGTGFDAQTGTAPSVIRGNHGTACAGIIGAVQNNVGVSGVAPNSRISSISVNFEGTTTTQMLADGINWAVNNGAAIISNSWTGGAPSGIFDNAITNALTNGRGGLGTIIVFATGNNNGAIPYPVNSNPGILAVGAMSPCGQRKNPASCDGENWWGGNFGATLDVVAPGVLIPTTDRQGVAGYVGGDYTNTFNGTSSACPHVAGVAALVLSVNPNLTAQQVADIIEQSATKVRPDLYGYAVTAGRPNGTWHTEMGYGLVNAHAAVLLAQDCQDNLLVDQDVLGGNTDNRQAAITLTATNTLFNTASAVYHAGNQVLLQPGFHAQTGVAFHGYIEGCSGMFAARMQAPGGKIQSPPAVYADPADEQTPLPSLAERDDEMFTVSPNPFTHTTTFIYTVTEENSPVSLRVYNVTGGRVATLVQEAKVAPGRYTAVLNGEGLPDGLYLYRLEIGAAVRTGKLLLQR